MSTSVLRLIFDHAKLNTTHIEHTFSMSTSWRERLSFFVVGNVNGWVTLVGFETRLIASLQGETALLHAEKH